MLEITLIWIWFTLAMIRIMHYWASVDSDWEVKMKYALDEWEAWKNGDYETLKQVVRSKIMYQESRE